MTQINFSQTNTATKDRDGYPAVVIRSKIWPDEPEQWITASGESADLEHGVRDLAAALVQMADMMKRTRESGQHA